jgi:hypothetical protein
MNRIWLWIFVIGVVWAAAGNGCESQDRRLAQQTQEADARQVAQNQALARLVAEQQNMQNQIGSERGRLDQQRTALDDERHEMAAAKVRDPIVADALIGAATLIACGLPLVLAYFVLRGAHSSASDDAALGELLVQELVADEPLLLPRPLTPAIEQQPPEAEPPANITAIGDD